MDNGRINAVTKLRSQVPTLSATERKVALWILEKGESALYLSMSQIAQECSVSDTTVLRMCRNAGFAGFTDLKLSLAQDLVSPTQLIHENVDLNDSLLLIAEKVFKNNIQSLYDTLALLDEGLLRQAIQLIEKANHILIAGVGGSSFIAQTFHQHLFSLGIHSDAPIDVQYQVMHASLLNAGDLAIAVSYSGNTRDMELVLREAKQNGASTILITRNAKSIVAKHADLVLLSVSHEIRSEPIAARCAQLTLIDAIFVLYSFQHLEDSVENEKRISNSIAQKFF